MKKLKSINQLKSFDLHKMSENRISEIVGGQSGGTNVTQAYVTETCGGESWECGDNSYDYYTDGVWDYSFTQVLDTFQNGNCN